MNKVILPYEKIHAINDQGYDQSRMLSLMGLSQTVFNSFCVTACPPPGMKITNNFVLFEYQLIDREELAHGVMDEFRGAGKVIRFINRFDKKDTNADLDRLINTPDIRPEDIFEPFGLYIHPQVDFFDGIMTVDLYAEPIEWSEQKYHEMPEEHIKTRIVFALNLFYYIETRLRKERHRIKRLMPTPEQIERAEKTATPYESSPILIKDISVQYIYEPHEARKYQRHCEAWGVRGHYRHYKSGKVVYIRPHTKGIGKIKDTIYRFAEEDK